jgi:tetratricopeptide (TPR) repeat protein
MNRKINVIHRFFLFFSPWCETYRHAAVVKNIYQEEVKSILMKVRKDFLPHISLGIVFCSITILITVALSDLNAQLPFTTREISSEFNRGLELFNKEKYPAAIRLFDSYINGNDKSNLILITEAEYFSAISSLKLFNSDAEHRMVVFISKHPESPRINEAWLALGDYFYQNKNYRRAGRYYESVNRQELDDTRLSEYFFRLGYSLYLTGDKPRALLMFSEIKDIDTEYTPPAIYYFSQIAYEDKMYQTAMDGFIRLKEDETFGGVVPFYIVQILYLQ